MAASDHLATGAGRSTFIARAVEWLRAGYPAGIPRQDYVALLGLLRRKLTDVEVAQIAEALITAQAATPPGAPDVDGPRGDTGITRSEIEHMISQSVLQPPSAQDVARVSAHLAAGGWPPADPPTT